MTKQAVFICLSVIIFCSCSYHFYNKQEVIRDAKSRNRKGIKTVVHDEGRVLKVSTRDSNYQKLDVVYKFDDTGKQIKYMVMAYCDSCFQKYVAEIVSSKNYKWKKT